MTILQVGKGRFIDILFLSIFLDFSTGRFQSIINQMQTKVLLSANRQAQSSLLCHDSLFHWLCSYFFLPPCDWFSNGKWSFCLVLCELLTTLLHLVLAFPHRHSTFSPAKRLFLFSWFISILLFYLGILGAPLYGKSTVWLNRLNISLDFRSCDLFFFFGIIVIVLN